MQELHSKTRALYGQYAAAYPFIEAMRAPLMAAFELLDGCYKSGGKLLICGNGGSNADAEHMVGELGKSFLLRRPLDTALQKRLRAQGDDGELLAEKLQAPLPAVNLGAHTSLGSAVANDTDAALGFSQQLLSQGRPGDVLLAISTSGNSRNILLAAITARALGMRTLGLTGRDGGRLAGLCDAELRVPENEVFFIQEKHVALYHLLCGMLEAQRWGE